MDEQKIPQNQEQLGSWVREQFQKANKHLAANGVLFKSVVIEDCRYMAPFCAVWKINANDKKQYWVISGDVPADYLPLSTAEDARSAMKYFSFKWQMQAEEIRNTLVKDKTQLDYALLLETKAEEIYKVQDKSELWQEQ